MKVLVGCEMYGRVRDAFRARGHQAYSCDLEPDVTGSRYHLQMDVFKAIELKKWDLAIFHPPCTFLANSGVQHLYKNGEKNKERWRNMREGSAFFKRLLECSIPKFAVENPIQHCHARKLIGFQQDQVIQPWMFGHMEQKATCLWLNNLPLLVPTNNVKAEMMKLPNNQRQRLHFLGPSKDRAMLRSQTFLGIADAMAQQWET